MRQLKKYKSCTVYLYTVYLLFSLFAITACNKEDSTETEWIKNNQDAYNAIKADPAWTALRTDLIGGPTGVYYKDISDPNTEKGAEHPLQTASVTINYTGKDYTGTTFDNGNRTTFRVNNVVEGFSAALQNMVAGEKWEVCIPYCLGYGAAGSGSIKGYTTLFFEIELLKVEQYPK